MWTIDGIPRCTRVRPTWDGPRQGGLAGAVGGSAPGGRAEPRPDVVRTSDNHSRSGASARDSVRGNCVACARRRWPSGKLAQRVRAPARHRRHRPRTGRLPCRGLLRPGQDDHRRVQRAGLQPPLPPRGPDQQAGRAAQRLRAVAAPALRRRREHDGAAAPPDHRAVHRLGGRPGPRHRGRDAARDRAAAGLRGGDRADRRAPGARRTRWSCCPRPGWRSSSRSPRWSERTAAWPPGWECRTAATTA